MGKTETNQVTISVTVSRSEAVEILSFLEGFPVGTACGGCQDNGQSEERRVTSPNTDTQALARPLSDESQVKAEPQAIPTAKQLGQALDAAVTRVGVAKTKATLQAFGPSLADVPEEKRAELLAKVEALV